MGAIRFLSPALGVGVTAGGLSCAGRLVATPVWLAVSGDGGRTWQPRGRALPTPPGPPRMGLVQQVVATSVSRVWALTADGRVLATADGGRGWSRLALPRPVVQLTQARGFLWALSCPRETDSECRPVLERARPSGAWAQLPFPPLSAMPDPKLTVSQRAVLVYVERYPSGRGALIALGRRSVLRGAPGWDGRACTINGGLFSAGSRTWLLCIGGAAAGTSTKGLLRSDDGGRTWMTVSAVTSLMHSPQPGSIATGEPNCLVAGSQARVWAAWQNGLSESEDGGAMWTEVPSINPQGFQCSLDALSPTHAWLLVAGAALWQTTDGVHWQTDGPASPAIAIP